MSAFRDTEAFSTGRWGEDEVRDWLRGQGKFVIPVNAIETGGAPRALGLMRNYTLPDLGVMGDGRSEWWEVKTKRKAAWNNHRGKHVHGIAKRLWHQYLAVESESGWPGHLAIVMQEPPRLVAARFAHLSDVVIPHIGSWQVFGEEMVWFDLEDFHVLLASATWHIPAPLPLEVTVVHPWAEPPMPAWNETKLPLEWQ
jgi:hypothetical protein